MGNITSLALGTARTATFSYSSTLPKLTSVTENSVNRPVGYDASGNETQVGTNFFTYSARNFLISGEKLYYLYDGRGLRVATLVGAAEPLLVSISPSSGPASGGASVTLTGARFAAGTTVTIGGVAAGGVSFVSEQQVTATTPALSAGALYDVVVTVPGVGTATLTNGFFADFTDVGPGDFHDFVEKLARNGITQGCQAGLYCPNDSVSRAQMAIFIARAMAGGDGNVPVSGTVGGNPYNCTAGGTSVFTDVAPTDLFCRHVHYIAAQGVTQGCTSPTLYCPNDLVSRAQMAIFIARAIAGGDASVPQTYGPDPDTGRSYSCNPASPNLNFTDITTSDLFCKHVHYLWARAVVSGCTTTQYCPNDLVNRLAMSKFLANGFQLTLSPPYNRRYMFYLRPDRQ